jgi:hypothetical protein
MLFRHSKEHDEKVEKFLKMSDDEFDKYMCETYPLQFSERKLPMSQTCMCWGFCIGKGWYSILDELCSMNEVIAKLTGVRVIFGQIKEKFGGARFYYNLDTKESKLNKEETRIACYAIEDLISTKEELADFTCAECGEQRDGMITCGGWVYDVCPDCFKKLNPKRIDSLELWQKKSDLGDDMKDVIYYASDEELDALRKIADEFKKAKDDERERQRKESEAKYASTAPTESK